jgi:hypothetical protein
MIGYLREAKVGANRDLEACGMKKMKLKGVV